MEEQNEEPVVACPYCDRPSSVEGHIVTDGRVSQCPNISLNVVMNGRSTL